MTNTTAPRRKRRRLRLGISIPVAVAIVVASAVTTVIAIAATPHYASVQWSQARARLEIVNKAATTMNDTTANQPFDGDFSFAGS